MSDQHQPGFADVDATGQPARFAEYLRAVSATEFGRENKATALAALGLQPGMRALDVGCGLGDEVRAMAAIAGPEGRAVGVDTSAAFIAEAGEHAGREGSTAEFLVGDALALPFEDASFDAVRTERTLQHVGDPVAALAEMFRVAVPGGVVTASEPDWDTLVIDAEPLEISRRVQAAFRATVRNPAIGRALRRMFHSAGLADVVVQPVTFVITDAALASHLFDLPALADQLIAEGGADQSGVDAWLEAVAMAGHTDTFFAAATGFFVAGRKPT